MSWFHKVRLRLLGGFLRLLFLCVNSAEAAEDGSGYESSAGHGHAGPASGTHRQHSPVCLFVCFFNPPQQSSSNFLQSFCFISHPLRLLFSGTHSSVAGHSFFPPWAFSFPCSGESYLHFQSPAEIKQWMLSFMMLGFQICEGRSFTVFGLSAKKPNKRWKGQFNFFQGYLRTDGQISSEVCKTSYVSPPVLLLFLSSASGFFLRSLD